MTAWTVVAVDRLTCNNESGPDGATNTNRGLTTTANLMEAGALMADAQPSEYYRGRNGHIYLTPQARFEQYVDRSGECHRWTGTKHGKGYGHFSYQGRIRKAHTIALLLAGIEVPEGMTVDHVWKRGCRHKDCVRIDHLEIVPSAVNTLRGGNPCAVNARKTHCIRGHAFDAHNTRVNPNGTRNCRTCINESNREKRRRAAEARRAA